MTQAMTMTQAAYEFENDASGKELSECEHFKLALHQIGIEVSFDFANDIWRCKIEGDSEEQVKWTLAKLEMIDSDLERFKKRAEEASEQTHPIKVKANQRAHLVCQEAQEKAIKIVENATNKADFFRKEGDRKAEKITARANGEANKAQVKFSEMAMHLQEKDMHGSEAERVIAQGQREAFKLRRKADYEVYCVKQQAKRDGEKIIEGAQYEAARVKEVAKEQAYWIKEKAVDECQEIKDKAIKRRERVIQDVIDEMHQESKSRIFFTKG